METTYYSGIDLHKHTSYIATLNADGSLVKEANLKNHEGLIAAYFDSLPGTHKAVVESTPNWYWLADLLHERKIDLQLAHAKYLKAITYAKVKTDKVDAKTLARLLRMDMVPPGPSGEPDLARSTRHVAHPAHPAQATDDGFQCAQSALWEVQP